MSRVQTFEEANAEVLEYAEQNGLDVSGIQHCIDYDPGHDDLGSKVWCGKFLCHGCGGLIDICSYQTAEEIADPNIKPFVCSMPSPAVAQCDDCGRKHVFWNGKIGKVKWFPEPGGLNLTELR